MESIFNFGVNGLRHSRTLMWSIKIIIFSKVLLPFGPTTGANLHIILLIIVAAIPYT